MTKNSLPKLPLRFFRWFCNPDFVEDIEGDLWERFEHNVNEKSVRHARWTFTKDVIRLFRPGIIKPLFSNQRLNNLGMLRNYIKIATRNLLKQKLYSTINIGGLAVGLTCFILIFVYVHHELSYDNFYKKKDNIYRIYQQQLGNTFLGSDYFAVTPFSLANNLIDEYSEVENATSILERSALLTHNEKNFLEAGYWADDQFFKIFDYKFLKGNPEKSMTKPNSIILTESLAKKIFNYEKILGQPITISDYYGGKEYEVTGVIKDLPPNSSFTFSYITNIKSNPEYIRDTKETQWNGNSALTFLTLNNNSNPKDLESKLPALIQKYSGIKIGDAYPFKDTYHVQPLKDLHLFNDAHFDIGSKGNQQYVYLFSGIAILVLLLACVNYMNLAITRSIQRAKEVGLRKVIGATRSQLMGQFLGESVFIALVALALALALSFWLLPHFGAIIERPLSLSLVNTTLLIPVLSVLVLAVGLFSGSYPAFFISSIKPINTLKGKITNQSPKLKLQSVLVIMQYAVSIILIISSLVIYLQFDFIQNKELGYDKDHIMVVRTRSSELKKNIELLKNELLPYSKIVSIATSSNLPSDIESSTLMRLKEEGANADNIAIYRTTVDYDYLKTFGLKLIAGRNYSQDIESDKDKVIINESAAKSLGWTAEEAVGNQFFRVGQGYIEVIGVVKDFHMFSMHLAIQPLMISLRTDFFHYASIKLKPDNIQNTITLIEEGIQKYSQYPFEFQFMDAEFDKLYRTDIKLGKIFGVFTILSILIASLGLFGLAAYTAKQRTKEIGIRKVLGASVYLIISLMTRDFIKMVIVGFLIAMPAAWFIMSVWLQDYAYRIELQWWMFAFAGLIAGVISLFTISSQSIKAASANPVDSLRNE